MRIRYKDVFLALSALFYLAIFAGAQSAFSATGALDSQLIAQLADAGETEGGSYATMAVLYLLLPAGSHETVTVLVGLACIVAYFWQVRRREAAMTIAFLSLAPSILTLATFQKDTVLGVFVLSVFAVLLSRMKERTKLLAILAIYGVYASFFREYFYIIAVFFVMLMLLRRGGKLAIFYSLILGMFSLFFVPPEVYEILQGSRDSINAHRLNRPEWQRPRTAFLNPVPPDGLWNFILNYVYAMFRLNFYVLISPGIREIFLLFNSIAYIGIFMWGFKQSGTVSMAAALGLAHLIVLHFFEPDNGSYIRHLGSTLPYLTICINAFFATRRITIAGQPATPGVTRRVVQK